MTPAIAMVLWALSAATQGDPPRKFACEPSAEVQSALAPLLASPDLRQSEKQRAAARAQLFAALRARFPGDLFVEARRIEYEKPADAQGRAAFAEPYRQRAGATAGDPVAAYLAALALAEWRTPEAIPLLQRTVEAAPELAQAHAALADLLSQPAFRDERRAQQHRRRAFALCPLLAVDFADQLSPGQRRQLQQLLAARLDGDPGRYLQLHPRYWELLFQQARPRAFPQVRERIRQQVAAIERLDPAAHAYRNGALIEGWKLIGDRARIRQAEDQLVARTPHSERAQAISANRWEAERHQTGLLSASAAWVRDWPAASWPWQQRVQAVFGPDAPATAQEIPTIEGALKAARENPEDCAWEWPLPLLLAERLTARGRHLDRVPEAVAAGLPLVERFLADSSDYYPPDKDNQRIRQAQVMWPVWTLVSEAALKQKHAGDAARAVEQLNAILGPLKPLEDWRRNHAELAEARARLALVQDRKTEALAFLHKAQAERVAGKLGPPDEDLQAQAEILFRALGTAEPTARQFRETTAALARTKPPQAPARWQPQSRKLPQFHLDALDGKVWSLSGLRDKVVFINIWSRGCGPCIQEMPALNLLHKRLAGRKDAVLLSINIDDDMGRLPLFMTDVGADFPVLLGRRWVDKVLPEVAIPRNWVVDPRGVLRAEQIGFAPEATHERWLESALAEIDRWSKTARR